MAEPLKHWPYGPPKQGSVSDSQTSHNESPVPQHPPSPSFPPALPPSQSHPLSPVPPQNPAQSSHVSIASSSAQPPAPYSPTSKISCTSPPAPRGPHYDFCASPTQITPPVRERINVSSPPAQRPHPPGQITPATDQYLPGRWPQPTNAIASGSTWTNVRAEYPPPPPAPSQPPSPPSSQTQSPRQESRGHMTVRALLNDDSSTSVSSLSPIAAQKRAQLPRSDDLRYILLIRQQPVRARSCGFGDRDRRVIDPPPILQLRIESSDLPPEEISRKLRQPSYVVHCSIWSESGEEEMSGMPDDYARQKRLMGSLVASPFVGTDEYGEEGCFFCFPDISCRTPGRYRLKFVLVVLDWPLRPTSMSKIRAELLSHVFQTYSAKDFPGMLESTPLAKALKFQGCNIPAKKGNDKGGKADGKADGGSEDNGSDGEASFPRSRKRGRSSDNL